MQSYPRVELGADQSPLGAVGMTQVRGGGCEYLTHERTQHIPWGDGGRRGVRTASSGLARFRTAVEAAAPARFSQMQPFVDQLT